MRTKFLPFSLPLIGAEEINEVVDVLNSGWLTTGPRTMQFEKDFSDHVGSKFAIAVNSATAALHLALEAIGLKAGDEVIVPTMTFAATAEVVRYFDAKPVLIDCRRDTFNIDTGKVEDYLEKNPGKAKAIIPVHIAGQPCDMDKIMKLGEKYGIKIIEDAAHALPAKYKGKMVGTIGDITAFSFYATKNITTGEGGMVVTDNEEYAWRMKIMSLHGISKDAWKRYTCEGSWYYEILYPGYKYNLTDIASAIGIHQLKKCDGFFKRREEIAGMFTEAFSTLEGITSPYVNPENQHAWHLYIIQVDPEKLTIDRSRFIEEMKARNIGTSVHFIPLHMHPYYRSTYGYSPDDFPDALHVYQRIVSLPIYPKMTDEDVNDVIDAVKDIVNKSRKK